MNRWWADADQALKILDRVDDSDVVQGVGTAVLGYHGLAMGYLKPLSEQTLVDAQVIRAALAEVDLEPVAKALGAATRPVMGEASERYGELLAYNMHEQAIEATSRFVTALTNTGVDWPSAISRAADIHGVPLDRLGMAGDKLRGAKMAPLAQQDWADRALVGYAAHVGSREADGTVSKAMRTRSREFDEDEVRRDRMGRFATSEQSRVTSSQESRKNYQAYQEARKARREKRASRQSRVGLTVAAEEAPAERQRTAERQETQVASERSRERRREGRRANRRQNRRERRKAQAEALLTGVAEAPIESFHGSLLEPFSNETYTGIRTRTNQAYYMMVPAHIAKEIVESGGFNMGRLMNTRWPSTGEADTGAQMGHQIAGMEALDRDKRAQGIQNDFPVGSNVIIRFVGDSMAWNEGSDPHPNTDSEIAEGAVFTVVQDSTVSRDDDGFELDATDFAWRPTAASPKQAFRTISVRLDNPGMFAEVDPGHVKEDEFDAEDTPPLPHDWDWFGKSDDWNPNLHPRDEEGKFRTRHGGFVQVTSDKAARYQAYRDAKRRKAKKRARRANERVGLTVVAEEPTLRALAAERQAPANLQEASVERIERTRRRSRELARSQRIERRREARRELRRNGYQKDAAYDVSGLKAAFPSDEDVQFMLHMGETGGRYDDEAPYAAMMHRLGSQTRNGKQAVDVMDKDTPQGREIVASPTYESEVPVFDTADEADDFAMRFVNRMYSAWDGEAALTPRLSQFMREAEKNGSYVYPKATGHKTEDGKWVPKVFYSPPVENIATMLVGSEKDWARVSEGQIPRFTEAEPVPMSTLLASNGFDAKRIEATHDALVQVIRMDFMDNVKH